MKQRLVTDRVWTHAASDPYALTTRPRRHLLLYYILLKLLEILVVFLNVNLSIYVVISVKLGHYKSVKPF